MNVLLKIHATKRAQIRQFHMPKILRSEVENKFNYFSILSYLPESLCQFLFRRFFHYNCSYKDDFMIACRAWANSVKEEFEYAFRIIGI